MSIARRLQDPLAELVKIDPKSIGVGQYQHDVDQYRLAKQLDAVVEDAVNAVGVDLNMASAPLLARVSGLSRSLAEGIVFHRDQHGAFKSRKALLEVSRLGPKTFEQCAGFLRIRDGEEPLASARGRGSDDDLEGDGPIERRVADVQHPADAARSDDENPMGHARKSSRSRAKASAALGQASSRSSRSRRSNESGSSEYSRFTCTSATLEPCRK